jgi:hypothetical protein
MPHDTTKILLKLGPFEVGDESFIPVPLRICSHNSYRSKPFAITALQTGIDCWLMFGAFPEARVLLALWH